MRGFNINGLVKMAKVFTKSHAPELLVGLGITGMGLGTVLAVKATPKSIRKIEDEIQDINDESLEIATTSNIMYVPIDSLTFKEIIKLCWKDYIPAALTIVTGAVCIVGGTSINLKRNAALLTAYKISETTVKELQEYKDKVVDTIGEEKNKEIEDSIDKEHLDNVSINMDTVTISGNGPILYFDKMGGQWFRSDKETIREAINKLNHEMNSDMYVSLNDFYDEMGMPQTIAGRELGWNSGRGLIEPRFSSHVTEKGVPVVVLSTRLEPQTDYGKLY